MAGPWCNTVVPGLGSIPSAFAQPVSIPVRARPFPQGRSPTACGHRFSGRAGRVGERPLDARGDAKPISRQPYGLLNLGPLPRPHPLRQEPQPGAAVGEVVPVLTPRCLDLDLRHGPDRQRHRGRARGGQRLGRRVRAQKDAARWRAQGTCDQRQDRSRLHCQAPVSGRCVRRLLRPAPRPAR